MSYTPYVAAEIIFLVGSLGHAQISGIYCSPRRLKAWLSREGRADVRHVEPIATACPWYCVEFFNGKSMENIGKAWRHETQHQQNLDFDIFWPNEMQ